jgi:hypothetical protein
MRLVIPGVLTLAAVVAVQVADLDPESRESPPPLTVAGAMGGNALAFAGAEDGEEAYYASLTRHSSRIALMGATGRGLASDVSDEALTAVVQRLCATCHNDQLQTANLSLQHFDVAAATDMAETTEMMITKLRLNMMPPPGIPRPGGDTLLALVETLERKIDEAVAANPNPGVRPLLRMNQTEYERTVESLLGLRVDASAFLPPETISDGYDNIADVQAMSPAVLDGFMRAASEVSRLAVGDINAPSRQTTIRAIRTMSQLERVDGAPYGTRGGISVVHNFPADGEYTLRMEFHAIPTGQLYASTARGEKVEVSVNGERVQVLEMDRWMSEADPDGNTLRTEPFFVRAGPQRISAAFIPTFEGPVNDLLAPINQTLADTQIGAALGVTTVPHMRDLTITGPLKTTGVSETPSRARIFSCRPTQQDEEIACAREIVGRLGGEAYRRPLTEDDMAGLMSLYREGADRGGFEAGIRTALQGILASPHFVFRAERVADGSGQNEVAPLSGLALASRLSYFLWASPPDQELRTLAESGELQDPDVLVAQARRLLADPRSETLATRFASQWLRLQRLDVIHPDPRRHPEFDDRLKEDMRRETELLFNSLVQEDRGLMEFFVTDYTFVNERLARHYGIPGVAGDQFRRVELDDERRRGVFGQGSVLTLTSHANRTSPVDRGKYIMEVILGTSPPPPPPVPSLDQTASEDEESGRVLTVRERLEMHRANPTCNACHQFIDPLGLPLENFDVTGLWRIRDEGNPLDSRGQLWDGTPLESPQDLQQAMLDRPVPIVRNFTANMMRYALGRRLHYFDMPTVRAIAREAEADDYRLSSFILGIVMSDQFRMRGVEVMADDDGDR